MSQETGRMYMTNAIHWYPVPWMRATTTRNDIMYMYINKVQITQLNIIFLIMLQLHQTISGKNILLWTHCCMNVVINLLCKHVMNDNVQNKQVKEVLRHNSCSCNFWAVTISAINLKARVVCVLWGSVSCVWHNHLILGINSAKLYKAPSMDDKIHAGYHDYIHTKGRGNFDLRLYMWPGP